MQNILLFGLGMQEILVIAFIVLLLFGGKKIPELMKGLGAVPKEDRPAMGKVINDFKIQVEEKYKALSEKMEQLELQARNRKEALQGRDERGDGYHEGRGKREEG